MNHKAFLISIILSLTAQVALACSCSTVGIDSAFKNSSLIFKGKVTKWVHGLYFNYQGSSSTIINFEVSEGFKKAKANGGTISLVNYNTPCDFGFDENKEYIVFAHDVGYGHYSTSICDKTALTEDFSLDDLARLKELAANHVDDSSDYRDLLVLDKTSYNTLIDEKELLAKQVEDQSYKMRILIYSFAAVVLILFILILLQRKKLSSR